MFCAVQFFYWNPFYLSAKKKSALHYACSVGNLDQVKKSIEIDNSDPMKADQVGFYPLHYATINNQVECVKVNFINFILNFKNKVY